MLQIYMSVHNMHRYERRVSRGKSPYVDMDVHPCPFVTDLRRRNLLLRSVPEQVRERPAVSHFRGRSVKNAE
jgi:hypothetical protein